MLRVDCPDRLVNCMVRYALRMSTRGPPSRVPSAVPPCYSNLQTGDEGFFDLLLLRLLSNIAFSPANVAWPTSGFGNLVILFHVQSHTLSPSYQWFTYLIS